MATERGQLSRGGEQQAKESPIRVFAAATRALSEGETLSAVVDAVVRAVATVADSELVVARVLDRDGRRLSARSVHASSPALAAELEGARLDTDVVGREVMDEHGPLPDAVRSTAARVRANAILFVPVIVRARIVASLELARTGPHFDARERLMAELAGSQLGAAVRAFQGESDTGNGSVADARMLELAGDALAAAGAEAHTAEEITRLARVAAGARSGVLWRSDPGTPGELEPLASAGAEVDGRRRGLAVEALRSGRMTTVDQDPDGAWTVTVQLGRPSIGALQLGFAGEQPPTTEQLERLAAFAVSAARTLRAGEEARTQALELDRTRALLEVVAQASSQLSLAHALATAVGRVAELLDAAQVGVYLLEDGRLLAAAGRAIQGPHQPVAMRLLELVLGPFRGRGMLLVEDARHDPRLAGLKAELAETGIEAAVAAPLTVRGEVIGLLALYPPRGRSLTANEWALLGALAGQLAVTVQNARLHEQATQLGEERKLALAEQRRDKDKLEALYEISRSFAQSLSLEATLEAIVRTVVELLQLDAAVIRMPDARGGLLVPRAIHVADPALREAIEGVLLRPQPLDKHPGRRLFRMGKPLTLDASTAGNLSVHELLVPFLEKGSTAVVLPIATPAELLGTLTLLSLDPDRPITDEATEVALSLAAPAALALDNARLYQQQKEFADTMQRSLRPLSQPELPGLELGDVYESSARVDVGGDIYDFLTLEDGRLAVCLGDVTGHGIEAAADMAMAKYIFRSIVREHPDPADFLAAANDVVCGDIAPGKFITMLYLTIDPDSGKLACASAGHLAPRIVSPDGAVRSLDTQGLALGIEGAQTYDDVRETLSPGEAVVIYTDGVIEARRGGELFGTDRLEQLLEERHSLPPNELALAVVAECRAFSGGELADDCAVVVIRRAAKRLSATKSG